MKKKICPYCDRVMKVPGYCDFCSRMVFHPREQEVNYYLNERHPEVEENCLYHGDLRPDAGNEARHTETGEEVRRTRTGDEARHTEKTPLEKNISKPMKKRPAQMGQQGGTKSFGNGKKKKTNLVSVIVLIYLIVMVGSPLVKNFGGFERKAETAYVPEFVLEEAEAEYVSEIVPEEAEAEYVPELVPEEAETVYISEPVLVEEETLHDWERTDEQVQSAGIACNTFGHLDVSADMVISALRTNMENSGYSMGEYYRGSSNIEQGDYSVYNTYYNYELVEADEWGGRMQLYFDTATGQLHGMQLSVNNEKIWTAAEGVFGAVKELGLLDSDVDTNELLQSLIDEALEEELGLSEHNDLEIGMGIFEGEKDRTYTLMIFGKGYMT